MTTAVGETATSVSVDEARRLILQRIAKCAPISCALGDALGMVLAESVSAPFPLPPFANSAMDGFAVRTAELRGASVKKPVSLPLVGVAPAGRPPAELRPGTAMRIMTGAAIPAGADAVIRFEDADDAPLSKGDGGHPAHIGFRRVPRLGENIRPAGEDAPAGEEILAHRMTVGPAVIGMLAAVGYSTVTVYLRPIVGILATGDEVVEPGCPLGPGQIYNSNSHMVAALVQQAGGRPILLGIAGDNAADLRRHFRALPSLDLLITTGGVSVGDYDIVKQIMLADGDIALWQVRIKPGKPLAFGRIGTTPLLGLPGNPVAASVAFEQFARPAIRQMLGHCEGQVPTVRARLEARIENRGGHRNFVRVRVSREDGAFVARPAGLQGSGILTALVRANGLLVIPETVAMAEAGETFEVQLFDGAINTL